MFTILIVDDEPVIRKGIKNAIDWKKAEVDRVLTAPSAEEALKLITENDILALITDIKMDRMTGIELAEKAAEIKPDIKTIIMTAYDEFEYARQSIRLGVQDFLVKPVDEDELLKLIMRFAQEKKENEEKKYHLRHERRVLGSLEQKQLDKWMRLLISSSTEYSEVIRDICETYKYDLKQLMQIAILYPRAENPDAGFDNEYFDYAIVDFCTNNIDINDQGITFLDGNGRVVIAFFCEYTGKHHNTNKPENFIKLLNSEFHIRQKAAVGSVVEGFENLYISYNEAKILVESEITDLGEIVETPNVKRRNRIFWDAFSELKAVVLADSGDSNVVNKVVSTFEKMTESYDLSLSDVRHCCYELALIAYYGQILNNGGKEANDIPEFTKTIVASDIATAIEVTRAFLTSLYEKQEDLDLTIENTKKYINDHLAEKISVSGLADMNYLAPAYFSRLFKKAEGIGCNEYITRVRMKRAEYLLQKTNLKTGEIAELTGYEDRNYFTKTFKKYNGNIPSAYREMCRNKK